MIPTLACLLTLIAAEPADPRVESLWRAHYPRYARFFLAFEDGYVCVPGYDPRHPSTAGVTRPEAVRKLSVSYDEAIGGGMSRQRTRRPDDAEVEAFAAILPGLAVGHYGRIAAVRVDRVLGPEAMTIKGIQLIDDALDEAMDAERDAARGGDRREVEAYLDWRFRHRLAAAERQRDRAYRQEVRLAGFSTAGLRRRDVFRGPDDAGLDIAIVRLEQAGDEPDDLRLVAIPADRLRKLGVTEPQFEAALAERGYDKAGFVELIQQMHREQRDPLEAQRQVTVRLIAATPTAPPAAPDDAEPVTTDHPEPATD